MKRFLGNRVDLLFAETVASERETRVARSKGSCEYCRTSHLYSPVVGLVVALFSVADTAIFSASDQSAALLRARSYDRRFADFTVARRCRVGSESCGKLRPRRERGKKKCISREPYYFLFFLSIRKIPPYGFPICHSAGLRRGRGGGGEGGKERKADRNDA